MMKGYFENGKLQLEIPYKNGQVDGLVKRYDENGQVVEQATFKNGQEVKQNKLFVNKYLRGLFL